MLNLPLRYTRSGEHFSLWSAANEYLGSIGDESTAAAIVERCNGKPPVTMKYSRVAYGARFHYVGGTDIWIKLPCDDEYGRIARYDPEMIFHEQWSGQSICSLTDSGFDIEVVVVG